MIKISAFISGELAFQLEDYFDETANINWGIDKLNNATPPELFGYFETQNEADASFEELKILFPELPEKLNSEIVNPCDWQNEYKKYLQAWSIKNLHWVPIWEKENYKVPTGDKVFYFDAGLAFGTGDHPTTRLCAIRILDYLETCADPKNVYLIDAGCGSGILALSAKLLGIGKVYGFDFDPEAVRISKENAVFNNVPAENVLFEEADLIKGLNGKTCDILVANIQADILMKFSKELISAVKTGGLLILSGILAIENEETKNHFLQQAGSKIKSVESTVMGEWSDLRLQF